MAVAVFLACVFAVLMSGQPYQATRTDNHSTKAQGPPPPSAVNNCCDCTTAPNYDLNKSPKWYVSAEWWIVIVAALTLIAVAYQSRETARAAKAAQASTELLWESQRPQLAAGAHGSPSKDLMSDVPRVQLELTNKGMTPAYDLIYESWIEVLPSPFADFTPNADYFKAPERIAVYSNHTPVLLNLPIGKGLTQGQRRDLKELRLYVCVRIRAEYRDARTSGRYANFGFYVMADGLGFLPKYNDAN
jgi:hypothetical protein